MLNSVRDFVTSHNDVSKVVHGAEKFSVTLPVVGKVSVPPPKHMAFYSVLGVLGVTELIPWPVALGIGVGHALTVRGSGNGESAKPASPPEAADDSTPDA
ncbi:hypothetical protein [Mycobacterium sp. 141]|uniref:hypothetical protein n=1 Tax=Mycobacterium sp. 141 TaxID=1120797 RepID=UPI0003737989|nr:hypothetical protein [Mycobacterium sp. 141]